MNPDYRLTAFLLILLILVFLKRSKERDTAIHKRIELLSKQHPGQKIYFCIDAEEIDKNLVQLYGHPFGTSITPGMKIRGLNGMEYPLKEVYATDSTPDKPDPQIPENDKNSAVVIETNNWDWRRFNEVIKKDKVIAFQLV